ncbi:uncharacterized protein [Hetaerina americana]|uniref:uncharacterized protein n=1 Tax=Hetaerina americana TaxID=62018 RepID=UPI003A7F35D8
MLSNEKKWEEEEEEKMHSDVKKEYHHRVQRLQHYIPFLRKMIEHLEGARDKNRETQLIKIRSLLNILTNSHKKLKLETVQRCEGILRKLHSKFEGTYEWSICLPIEEENLSIHAEKEDAQNSNGSIDSPQTMELPLSMGSSSRDDSCNPQWRRRKTAMEFFEETPRSPSPPSSSELGDVTQPLVIPMEWKEDNLENPVIVPLEQPADQSVLTLDGNSEIPKTLTVPLGPRESFETQWYQGDTRYPDPGRQKNNFGVINSSLPSDPGISHQHSNIPQPSFVQEMPRYSPLHSHNPVPDIPNLEGIRNNWGDIDHPLKKSERMLIPISNGGEKYIKDYDHRKQPSPGWSADTFESRRNRFPFQQQKEPSNISVLGKGQVYDYGYGQFNPSDSLESTKDSLVENKYDKTKVSPKHVNSARASIREKLALEINKVHRVGVSSRGGLRSLCKTLSSPPHHKRVENRDAAQDIEPIFRKTVIPSKLKEVEQTADNVPANDRERKPSGSTNFASDDLQLINSSSSFFIPKENFIGVSATDSQERSSSYSICNAEKEEISPASSKIHQSNESKNDSGTCSESSSHEIIDEGRVRGEFSFKKKLLESKLSEGKLGPLIGSPSIALATSATSVEEDQSSKMSLCDEDSNSDPRIPFLDSEDALPLPDNNYPPTSSSCGFSEQRYLPNPCMTPGPRHISNPMIQQFVNPSNPNLSTTQGNIMDESTRGRIWPTPNQGGVGMFRNFCPRNSMQQNVNSPNTGNSQVIQHSITPSNHLIQPNNPPHNHNHHPASSRLMQQSQFLSGSCHPVHMMSVPPINQGNRPPLKPALLPDPVSQFRRGGGQNWAPGRGNSKVGLLPHPGPRPNWQKEPFTRPSINQYMAEPRPSTAGMGDGRCRGVRGGWNSRRGGFFKVNDPRMRKQDHSRLYYDSSEPPKKNEEKFWKHPSDPRRANPAILESKRPSPSIAKDKTTISSPLNSLYDADQTPKTGKGYGLQKFRIPKIKSHEPKDAVYRHQNPSRAVSPLRGISPFQKDTGENNENMTANEGLKGDKVDNVECNQQESSSKEISQNDEGQKEKEEKEKKAKEEFTKELVQTLLKYSLESNEGANIWDNTKFIDELREKLKLNPRRKSRPIIESDTETSEAEEEARPVVNKAKKRSRVIIESSESESCDEKQDDLVAAETSPTKTPPRVTRTRGARKATKAANVEQSDERPRTRSQRKLSEGAVAEEDTEQTLSEKGKKDEPLNEEGSDQKALESEGNDEDNNDTGDDGIAKTPNRRTKRRSSLELLQEDIREMFICEGVLSATGVRMCRLLKEAASVSDAKEETRAENTPAKNSEEPEENSVSSCKDGSSSEENIETTPLKLTRRRGSGKHEKVTKIDSLQPRVLLKKSEVVDRSDSHKTPQTTVRGSYARRFMRRAPNLGNRNLFSANKLAGGMPNEDELVSVDDTANEKEHLDDKDIRSSININTNVGEAVKESHSSEGSQSSEIDDATASGGNDDNLFHGESSGDSGTDKNDDGKLGKCCNNGNEGKPEEMGEQKNLDDQAVMGNSSSRLTVKRPTLKKVNSKARRSKVNRKWALGVLKRAVNHKRRALNVASSASTINKEPTPEEHMILTAPEEDLTDVNYTCMGSESLRCKLCTYNGKQIVNHYITKHPESDVLVSRLSLEQAKVAMDWTENNQGALRNAKEALKSRGPFVCLMCEAWFTEYIEFYDHVTTHTGEYRFSCKMCSYRSFRDTNVRSHAYYVHQKKYCESYECFEAVAVDKLLFDLEEEGSEPEATSLVIPGLVAHLCSKCNFVQIAEKGVKEHIAKRHKEDSIIKILKIDMSLISPEPPSGVFCDKNKKEEENAMTNLASEEATAFSRDDDGMNVSFKHLHVQKEEPQSCGWDDASQMKEVVDEADESEFETEVDETAFSIENCLLVDYTNENSARVWTEILNNPECDEEISIVKFKLYIKVEDDNDNCSTLSLNDAVETSADQYTQVIEDSKPSDLPVAKNASPKKELVSDAAGISDFGVIQLDGGKKPEEQTHDGAESHTSEVEIIEIDDDSDSSDSGESSEEVSSGSEDEWDSPSGSIKETLYSLDIIPEVKISTLLYGITTKCRERKVVDDLETKATVIIGGDDVEDVKAVEERGLVDGTELELRTSPNSSSAVSAKLEDAPNPRSGKIRVRCLSGDLLSSTKDPNILDGLTNAERDSLIDVIGTSSDVDSPADNPLCQISSVCSLHPNEQVPEEFIKAVSENETPDLTSLAAYSPNTGSPQPALAVSDDVMGDRVVYLSPVKNPRGYRPILPKGSISIKVLPIPHEELKVTRTENHDPYKSKMLVSQSNPEKLTKLHQPPKSASLESEGFGGQTLGQSCSQNKVCSIMRASLYAKASKTPAVFNQVISNQMKLCHLFKCMGRQCSFTTDESVLFLSHYLAHEALVLDPPAASTSTSGENSESHERRFDWQQCCYCAEMFSSATAYIKHVKVDHGECIYQCPYCFYRAAAVSYVILHQNSTHITEKVIVLKCKNPLKKGADEDNTICPIKPLVEAYVCYQGNCKKSFYSPTKYFSHLHLEHSAVSIFCCHKCSFQCFKADRLVQHYKLHSFFLYQCVYCEQGSDTSEEILQHLASFHPNKKASVCRRNCEEISNGSSRTTGRHPYILYEDIELTRMDNVELIEVGEEMGKSTVIRIAAEKSVLGIERVPDSKPYEDFMDVDDDNSDDEDNLVIAEEPDEEMPAKENDDSIVGAETRSKGKDIEEENVQHQENNGGACHEEEVTQEEEIEKITEVALPEEENDVEIICRHEKDKNEEARAEEMDESGSAEDTPVSLPNSNFKLNQSNFVPKSPNSKELVAQGPKGNKAAKHGDELNVSTTDDEVIEVSEGSRRDSGGEEMRLLRKRDLRRQVRISTRSQVESKPKSTTEESHVACNRPKEAQPPSKDLSNRKIDLAKLYLCCFPGCSFLAKDCNGLKYHMKSCPHSKNTKEYMCPHCNRKFKSLPPVLKHLRAHGKKSYVCMICGYQGYNMSLAVRHVKFRHRTHSATVSPLTDWKEPEELHSSVKDQKLVVVAPKEVSLSCLLRKRFIPDDADFLPLPCVYNNEAKCGRCSYSTKIRVNMRRHLHLHLRFNQMAEVITDANLVPWSIKDIINPMPCLEGKELMFDKMTNWAISSHLDAQVNDEDAKSESRRNSSVSEYEEDNFIPRFVPENERYVCGVVGCHYQTVDDTMLRHHLRALHREEVTFRCAHCPDDQNSLLQVPVDRLASHLKMHDDQLYQCIHCNYFHFQRRFVERHTVDKHSDLSHMVNVIREPDTCSKTITGPGSSGMAGTGADGSIRSSNASIESSKQESDNVWNCGLCSYSCSNRESISDHARISHSVFSQYVCGMCAFRTAYLGSFNVHFSSKHLGYPVQLTANYFRSNIAALAPPAVTIALPNGKIIFPPNPLSSKNVDIRSEPVIEVWPYVEQGFGKSPSSSVRLKELNTTYPWQRCMPRVRYIRGIPLADEGEETMYDLAESLKIKDEIQNDEGTDEERNSHSRNCESEKLEVCSIDESGEGSDVEVLESAMEDLSQEEIKKSAKRRMSDPSKRESDPSENKHGTESGRSLTPVKTSPNKRSLREISPLSPIQPKIPKMEAAEKKSSKNEEVIPVSTEDASHESEKKSAESASSKIEFLVKQYGEFGVPEGNLFVCPICSKYKTKYKGDMKDHFYRELNYKRFVCTHCGFLAPVKSRLQKHYLRVHKKEGKREAVAELPPDNDIELWMSSALSHQCGMMKSMASNQPQAPASSEGSTGPSSCNLRMPSGEGGAPKTHFSCKYCVSKFATTRGVKLHFKVHHLKIGSWICGYCDVSANSSAIIVKHSKASHPDRPELIVNNSLGSFVDAKTLDDSITIYGNGLSNLNERASSKASVRSDSEGASFHCSFCDHQTCREDDHKKHEKSHGTSKGYGCGHCSFTATLENDVLDHHSKNHPSLFPEIIDGFESMGEKSVEKSIAQQSNGEDPEITVIDVCGEPEESKAAVVDIAVEQEIVVTLDNIGEFGKSNPSFVFKCYYCRMKSFSCDDVVNHWENTHLPTDIHNTHPFKCKRIFAVNHYTFPHQLFQCAFCNQKGSVLELKEHFKTDHHEINFKVLNLQITNYCCLLCEFSSQSFTTFEKHSKSAHFAKDLEYQMRLANIDESVSENCGRAEGVVLGTVIGNSFKANSKRDTSEEEHFLKDAGFSCCVCNNVYSTFDALEKHHAHNHDSSTLRFMIEVKSVKSNECFYLPENIVKTYSCSSCPFSTQSFSKMFEHIRFHTLPYQCGHCNFQAEIPSKVSEHHFKEHPIISTPAIVINRQADLEMARLYKEIKVTCGFAELKENASKHRAPPATLLNEPKKNCPVARKSTTQIFPTRGFQKPTARKSTNPSGGFLRNLKLLQESAKLTEEVSSSEEQDVHSVKSDGGVGMPRTTEEYSYYTGGKGQFKQSVNLSRITVWMTFGGCAAKRVPVSKMAQLVDLEPHLCIGDIGHQNCGS